MDKLIEAVTKNGGEVRFAQSGEGVQCWVRLASGRICDAIKHFDEGGAAAAFQAAYEDSQATGQQ